MKVNAYRCDYCGAIKTEKRIVGIDPQPDMFNKIKGFPVKSNPEKTNVHVCVDCMREHAHIPASNKVNRKKDEQGYRLAYEELSFLIRSQCVQNVYNRKVFKIDA
jgi:hypothetical protein